VDKKERKEYLKQYQRDHPEMTRQWAKDNPEKVKEFQEQFRKVNYEKIREKNFKRNYNLSYKEWEGLWYAQDGRCAICDNFFVEMKAIYVDHNHKTGKTRGLLCHNCNSGIGFLNDDPELTMKATEYLIGE